MKKLNNILFGILSLTYVPSVAGNYGGYCAQQKVIDRLCCEDNNDPGWNCKKCDFASSDTCNNVSHQEHERCHYDRTDRCSLMNIDCSLT